MSADSSTVVEGDRHDFLHQSDADLASSSTAPFDMFSDSGTNSLASDFHAITDVVQAPRGSSKEFRIHSRPSLRDGALSDEVAWYPPPRRAYARWELLADRIVNCVGAGLAWPAVLLLGYLTWAAGDEPMKQVCFWVFGAGMIIMLNCSALYHLWAWDWRHSTQLLSLDHVGISAMIMGCYAPFMHLAGCYKVLVFVWIAGIAVVPMEAPKFLCAHRETDEQWSTMDKLHIVRYLAMGWSCLAAVPSLIKAFPIPWNAAIAALVGGIIYTMGVPIFVRHSLKGHLAIWHSCVLIASAIFYFANALVLVGPQ